MLIGHQVWSLTSWLQDELLTHWLVNETDSLNTELFLQSSAVSCKKTVQSLNVAWFLSVFMKIFGILIHHSIQMCRRPNLLRNKWMIFKNGQKKKKKKKLTNTFKKHLNYFTSVYKLWWIYELYINGHNSLFLCLLVFIMCSVYLNILLKFFIYLVCY